MAAQTISGTIGGTFVTFPVSSTLQAALAQSIVNSATTIGAASLFAGSSGFLTTSSTVDISQTGSVLTGLAPTITPATVTASQVLLGGQLGVYFTGATNPLTPSTSIVVAADNTNSSIVNDNLSGGLIGVTGAGGNVLLGLTGQNNFFTGTGGQDIVVLDGATNNLSSSGSDAVLVGGASTIQATASGIDSVLLTSGTTLNFINGSRLAADSITGAANSFIQVAGTGATSITSGVGPESFKIDTGAGNVTLNGSAQANDLFTFTKDAAINSSSATAIVTNFGAGSQVNVTGYAGAEFTITAAANGIGATLNLTDGSSVTFTNLTTTALAGVVKVV